MKNDREKLSNEQNLFNHTKTLKKTNPPVQKHKIKTTTPDELLFILDQAENGEHQLLSKIRIDDATSCTAELEKRIEKPEKNFKSSETRLFYNVKSIISPMRINASVASTITRMASTVKSYNSSKPQTAVESRNENYIASRRVTREGNTAKSGISRRKSDYRTQKLIDSEIENSSRVHTPMW